MKRFFALATALVMAFAALTTAYAEEERPPLLYFFENYCESCEPEAEFAEEFHALTGNSLSDYRCSFYNQRYEAAREALAEVSAQYAIENPSMKLPILVVDGRVYLGDSAIQSELPKDALGEPGAQESVLIYLYVAACESCARAVKALEKLPDEVEIARGEYRFPSEVRIERFDIGDDPAFARALFEAYSVPEDRRLAPIVFLGDTFLSGADEIERKLAPLVHAGAAVGGTREISEQAADAASFQFLGAFTAGIVGGLNPCALSMLLLFLSLLLSARGKTASAAVTYLAAKFVTYMLIGTVFYTAFRQWNPAWLPAALKILTTVLCVAFIGLNLWDALAARREEYGRIKNQLPSRVRSFAHARVKKAFDHRARLLSFALLGVVIAASEFLCAGQVYLSTLLWALQTRVDAARMTYLLATYCAGFILPSGVVCALIRMGAGLPLVSEFLRRRMPLIKLLTALLFAALLVVLWG